MKNIMVRGNSIVTLIGPLLLLLLLQHSTPTKAQEVEDESGFNYINGSAKGPERWGDLSPDWATCNNGTMQSPIDISNPNLEIILSSMGLNRNYAPQNATLVNRGHDIMIRWEGDAGSVLLNGTEFVPRQVHWHSPSEHTINGTRYALELHMVHQSTDPNLNGSVAVIAVLYKFGDLDPFLSKLASNISLLIDQVNEERNTGMINPMDIQMNSGSYYKYIGSLTTPPCTEGVLWIISKKIRDVSRSQVQLLREAVNDDSENNARPLQPLN